MPAHFRTFRTTGNHSSSVFLIPQSLDVGTAIDELVLIWLASEASEWQDRLEWLLQYRQELVSGKRRRSKPDDGVLQFLGRHECRAARLDEAGDSAASLEHVVQV